MRRVESALLVGAIAVGCGGGSASPAAPVQCSGEARVPLHCESEFKYEGRRIEGGFSAIGIGAGSAKTDEVALRAIDKETEQYAAQARRLCDEYNACILDKATYATRSENLRRRMGRVPELYDGVKSAADDDARRRALAVAYRELVPDEARRELSLELAALAQTPSDAALRPIGPGERLPTGTRVAFVVRPSKSAYVYLFQKGPDGKVNVLFPDPRIGVKNPLAAGADLRLPPGSASFKLNDKDVGTERVYVVASLEPVASLDAALGGAGGAEPPRAIARVTEVGASGAGCTRALELDEGARCLRPRGLELDGDERPEPRRAVSLKASTEAADSVIVQVFAFEHTR